MRLLGAGREDQHMYSLTDHAQRLRSTFATTLAEILRDQRAVPGGINRLLKRDASRDAVPLALGDVEADVRLFTVYTVIQSYEVARQA
jgi:hypothetical protein